MRVAIYTRGLEAEQKEYVQKLLQELLQNNMQPVLHHYFKSSAGYISIINQCDFFETPDDLSNNISFFITLGGDGTLLDSVNFVRYRNIPVLGINFGRLGFLAPTAKEDISYLVQSLKQHSYTLDKRTLIHVDASSPIFGETPFALNEFSLHKKDVSPMIRTHTYLNGEYLNTYWSDGLVISTPTGSTGYNLSLNGPIVFPQSSTFVITPIAPHNLNNRPIVVPDDTVITMEVEGRTDQFICTLDARRELVDIKTTIAIRKEQFSLSLVQLPENNFLQTLRSKLGWGQDVRN
jgi:NAD+ kinase